MPTYTSEPVAQPETIRPQIKSGHFLQVSFYRQFFDLNTEEFFGKIQQALNPFNTASVVATQDENDATELYGFVWITATLIFLMFVSSTGSNILLHWLHSGKDDTKYEYNFGLLSISLSLFYGYTIALPALIFVLTSWVVKFPERLSLTRLVSIYSYSNVLWFPITAANFVLVVFVSSKNHHKLLNLLQWVIVAVTGAVSGLSIVLKVRPIFLKNALALDPENSGEGIKKYQIMLFLLIAAHIAFTVLVKVLFFGIN